MHYRIKSTKINIFNREGASTTSAPNRFIHKVMQLHKLY